MTEPKNVRLSILSGIYGSLLSDMQQKVTEMYCDKDMSLGEISESLGISRQGVRDSLLKAEKYLDNYEQILKLGGILNQLTAIAESDESDAGAIKAKLSEIINNIKE